jgi:Ca2+:H+ antiporter
LARKILWGSLALGPIVVVLNFVGTGETTLFVLAAAALVPLAWLIGVGGRGELDRESTFVSLGLVALATLLFLVPAIPGWSGDPERDSIELLSLPVSVALLLVYLAVTWFALRRHHELHTSEPAPNEELGQPWPLRVALAVLAAATVVTAFVAETLVHSLTEFGEAVHLSDFFLAAVVVAIVGNAAEHGGAVVVAYRGQIKLAAEIALASSAQVAVFLVPAVALLAWLIDPLALSFRQVELLVLGGSVLLALALLFQGQSSRWRGAGLIAAYVAAAVAFFVAGDR